MQRKGHLSQSDPESGNNSESAGDEDKIGEREDGNANLTEKKLMKLKSRHIARKSKGMVSFPWVVFTTVVTTVLLLVTL